MEAWRAQMPKGMLLKSEGFASSLSEPAGEFRLADYCREAGLPYADVGMPVPLDTFVAYGLQFQKRFVPDVETKLVTLIAGRAHDFELRLENGDRVTAANVVVATGLAGFEAVPSVLASLPRERISHSCRHSSFDAFEGRKVLVVGAGASAIDVAAGLARAGAEVEIVGRTSSIRFHNPPLRRRRTLLERLRSPLTGIGNGWNVFWCTNLPGVFRQMPERFRLDRVRRILGPAPGWFMKDEIVGKVPLNLGVSIGSAAVENDRVRLDLVATDGTRRSLSGDHVIAATGYKVDLRRLPFLAADVLRDIRTVEHTPVLSSHFESSVPGLYFVGLAAANTFGPLLRFAFGTRFTARRLSAHLARTAPAPAVRRSLAVGRRTT